MTDVASKPRCANHLMQLPDPDTPRVRRAGDDLIGAFPWKFEGGEACPCRILAIFDAGSMTVEEVKTKL